MTSVRYKFILPLLILGALIISIEYAFSQRVALQLLHDSSAVQAKNLANAIKQLSIEANDKISLRQFVRMVGGAEQIREVILLGGEPLRVLASTDASLVGEFSENVLHPDDLHATSNPAQHTVIFKPDINEVNYYQPIDVKPVSEAQALMSEAVLLAVFLDIKEEIQAIKKNALLAVLVGSVCLTLLIACVICIYYRVIEIPLSNLINAINHRLQGEAADAIIFAEDEMGEVSKQYNQLVQRLTASEHAAKELARTKANFLSNMSHEIRTPLAAMLGHVEILELKLKQMHMVDEQAITQRILLNTEHLLYLVNDVLDFSKIEAKKLSFDKKQFSLTTLFTEIKKIFSVAAKEKNVRLEFHMIEPLPLYACSDKHRLQQVVYNMLSNAIKFTGSGGQVTVSVKYLADKSQLSIKVADTGIGIPPAVMQEIFEPFVQNDCGLTRKAGGTGLGLAISKELCRLFGGDLLCESVEGVGSTFTAVIELADVSYDTVKMTETVDDEMTFTEGNFPNKHVLVVEDVVDNQKIITWHLEQWGISFDLARNGEEALGYISHKKYDLILMDIQMPAMDGMTAVKHIRDQGITSHIIALTANAMKEQVDEYFECGFNGFLPKPFKRVELWRELVKVFGPPKTVPEVTEHVKLNAKRPTPVYARPSKSVQQFEESDAFANIKKEFSSSLAAKISELNAIVSRKDEAGLRLCAHSLKSVALTFGFNEVGELAKDVERLCDANEFSKACDKVDSLVEALQRASEDEEGQSD